MRQLNLEPISDKVIRVVRRSILPLLAALLAGNALPALADCVPTEFPPDYLEREETAGGHTLARHVGKSDEWLMARLAGDAHLHFASSYADRAAAEAAIERLLDRHRARINRWAARAPDGAEFTVRGAADGPIGHTAWRPVGPDHLVESHTIIVVVKKLDTARCLVLTSYPAP